MIRPRRSVRFLVSSSLGATAIMFASSPAWADCVTDGTGLTINCTGTAAGTTSTTPNVKVVVASGATITGTGISATGTGSSVDNTGSINTGAGITAIALGGGGLVTQQSAATGAITGNIVFGDAGAATNRLTNLSTSFGIIGNTSSIGNFLVNNSGTVSGNLVQTRGSTPGTVAINNLTGGVVSGSISTQDATTLTNAGTITGSVTSTAPLTIVNTGTLTTGITVNAQATGASALTITNSGAITGNIVENAGTTAGTVSITNQSAGRIVGNITVADAMTFNNAGTYTGAIKSETAFAAITNSGTMTATGSFVGSLTNSGTLITATPTSTSTGILTVVGNYVQTSAGTLKIALGSSTTGTSYGQISTTGTATLAGTVTLTPAQGFYPTGSVYNFVIADQGIVNNGFTVTGTGAVSPFLTFTSNGIVSTGNGTVPGQQALQFTATRAASYAAVLTPTATANQLIIARAFQPLVATATATPTGDAAALVGAVDYMTIAQAQKFFDQVSPEGYRAYVTALQDQGTLFNRQVSLRLDTIVISKELIGLWVQPYWQRGRMGAANGSGQDIYGASAGYDIGTESAKAGIAVGYSNAKLRFNPGNLVGKQDSFQVAVYGGVVWKGFNADLQLGYVNGKLSSTKVAALGTTTRTAAATANGHLFKAVGTIGYDLGNADNQIQPFVAVDASKGNISSFTETGANAANLTVSKLNADRTDVLVGLDYSRKTGSLLPYLHVAYRRNLQSPNGQVSAQFSGVAATAFTVNGVVPARSQQDVNVGLRKKIHDDNSQVFVGYQGTFREGGNSHGANLGLFVTF